MAEENDATIDKVNAEIEKEIGAPIFGEAPYEVQTGKTRKSYRLHDFEAPHDKEMAVFTHAKKFSEYIFVITKKSPVSLRWSIVSRLQNISVEIVEKLYRANYAEGAERENLQRQALSCISLADHFAVTAKTMQAINFHQLTVIAPQLFELKKLLQGWIRSDKRRNQGDKGGNN